MRGDDPDVLRYIKKIAEDEYFDAIEVTWIKDPALRKQAADLLAQSHLTVCYGAQPRLLTTGLNPNHTDEAERQKAEATLIEAVDEARELGANGIAFLSGKYAETRK
jgi:sugar phosphate isomerase/epimerase